MLKRVILRLALFAGIAGTATLHPSVAAPTLFGMRNNASSNVFGTIDPNTGAFTELGGASFQAGYYAPVYDPLDNSFYVTGAPIGPNSTNTIQQINAATGAVTPINVATPTFQTITALGVNSVTGALFGMRNNASSNVFGTIDRTTGAFTELGGASFQAGYYALVYDPLNNSFYTTGAPIGPNSTNTIQQINAATGAVTPINVAPPIFQTITALGVNPVTGALFGMRNNASSNVFGTIDPNTGAFTELGGASFQAGYYAPVYDPLDNSFYVTGAPIGPNSTNLIQQINAATGSVTPIYVATPIFQTITALGVGDADQSIGSGNPVPEPAGLGILAASLMILLSISHSRQRAIRPELNAHARSGRNPFDHAAGG